MTPLTARGIALALRLPSEGLEAAPSDAESACAEWLCDRPLSVEPVIRPLMEAAAIDEAGQERVLGVLRPFRAAVRGLDDLLDRSEAEPSGRAAAWTRWGPEVTVAACLRLWEASVEGVACEGARAAVLRESAAMLAAVRLEEAVAAAPVQDVRAIEELTDVERRIRDKELAYWRMVGALVAAEWSGPAEAWEGKGALLVRLADVWQRLDDARDIDEDLARGRLSSFLVELLRDPPGEPAPPTSELVSWRVRLEGLVRRSPGGVLQRRAEVERRLRGEEERLRRALAAPPAPGP